MKTVMQKLKEQLQGKANDPMGIQIENDIFQRVVNVIDEVYLEKEAQEKKQECIEFSKYIRNGKDHFNNGYSTEMVYDEWIEKSKLQPE